MSAPLPESYVGEYRGQTFMLCGLCGQRTVPLEVGASLRDLIAGVRAHQRSEVCG